MSAKRVRGDNELKTESGDYGVIRSYDDSQSMHCLDERFIM